MKSQDRGKGAATVLHHPHTLLLLLMLQLMQERQRERETSLLRQRLEDKRTGKESS